jgi:predicted HD superfamily hydrolase involved in NAD metabolism
MEDHAKTHTLLERAEAFARSRLSERRYEHTLRVADTAERLALAHDLDADRARLAALLHDAARETGPEEYLKLADQWHLQVGDPERQSPKLLHGPVAAELARRELGIDDEEVLIAVRAHTTGRPEMGPLALVLYVADKIEPARDYPSVGRLRTLASEDLRRAAEESLRRAIAHNEERGKATHPASLKMLDWLKADHTAQSRIEYQQSVEGEGESHEGHANLGGSAGPDTPRQQPERLSHGPKERHAAGVERVGEDVRSVAGDEGEVEVRETSQKQQD